MEYIVNKKWNWVDCNLVIKRLPHKEHQQGLYQSLEAEVELVSEESEIKNFQLDIKMEKNFQFQKDKGFVWHKSWHIPEINVKLSSKITKMLKQQNLIKKIYCQMLSGYPFKKDEHFYLQEIKLQGETIQQFNKKGEVNFSNIKFSETSFNKNKNKFSLILVHYTVRKQNQKSIIRSYISSPIHVDSRKQARKKISAHTFIQEQISINKFQQSLQGVQKLLNQNYRYEDILTINGFIKYYTAANIRFKIKHPYYIGYHFYNIFEIYYNAEQATDPVHVLELIYQTELLENEKYKIKPKPKKQMFTDNKEILKKNCPKLLTFLIKNTSKSCFLIKQQQLLNLEKQKCQNQKPMNYIQNQKSMSIVFPRQTIISQPHINQNPQVLSNQIQASQRQGQNNAQIIRIDEKKEQKSPEIKQDESRAMAQYIIPKKDILKNENTKQDEAIRKIHAIFQSWKYNFAYLKKSDGGLTALNKKWIMITQSELYLCFKEYYQKTRIKCLIDEKNLNRQDHLNNKNSYLNYELHQVITLHNNESKVKIQYNQQNH